MKKTLFSMLLCMPFALAMSQPLVKNASFENWTTRFGKNYPVGWTCDSFYLVHDYVKRVTPGSQGTYAVQVGSYLESGTVYGADLEIYDTFSSLPGNLQFEYKEFNNSNPLFNGLAVKIVLYDSSDNYISDYSWYSNGNKGSFNTNTLAISYPLNPRPLTYILRISYINFGGLTSEYSIIDNLRFLKRVSSVETSSLNALLVYPNPATDELILENNGNTIITSATLLSPDGKQIELQPSDSKLDVSGVAPGIYSLLVFDADNNQVGSRIVKIFR